MFLGENEYKLQKKINSVHCTRKNKGNPQGEVEGGANGTTKVRVVGGKDQIL